MKTTILSTSNHNCEYLTEFAARVCYNSMGNFGRKDDFVKQVLGWDKDEDENRHLSVAEHWRVIALFECSWTLDDSTQMHLVEIANVPGVLVSFYPEGNVGTEIIMTLNLRHLIEYRWNPFVSAIIRELDEHGCSLFK